MAWLSKNFVERALKGKTQKNMILAFKGRHATETIYYIFFATKFHPRNKIDTRLNEWSYWVSQKSEVLLKSFFLI